MHIELSEEKFSKGIEGEKKGATLLKQTPKDRSCIHAVGSLQLIAWKSVEVLKNNTRKIG